MPAKGCTVAKVADMHAMPWVKKGSQPPSRGSGNAHACLAEGSRVFEREAAAASAAVKPASGTPAAFRHRLSQSTRADRDMHRLGDAVATEMHGRAVRRDGRWLRQAGCWLDAVHCRRRQPRLPGRSRTARGCRMRSLGHPLFVGRAMGVATTRAGAGGSQGYARANCAKHPEGFRGDQDRL